MTILDTLENAEHNLKSQLTNIRLLGFEQLHNATMLLIKGYSPYEDINRIMEGHKNIDTVPEKI